MTVSGGNHGQSQGGGDYEERVVLDTRPCYVRYSLRGLGVFAGGLALVFGILNLFLHPLSLGCVVFSIIQMVIGFFVATTEAAGGTVRICHCIFLNRFPSFSDWLERQPLWVKPICYILMPLPGMILCTTWWTFFGGGFVLFTGIAYSISLWKQEPQLNQNSTAQNNHSSPTPATNFNSSQPTTNNMFPKYSNNSNNNRTSTSPTVTQQVRPTIIDIRQNNATSPGKGGTTGGKSSPMNPLASLTNYGSGAAGGSHKNDYDDGGESGGDWNNGRYENISVISGQTGNTRTPTTAIELGVPGDFSRNVNSFYRNVDLDESGATGGGPMGGGTFPDNPFVPDTRNKNTVTIVTRNQNLRRGYSNDVEEDEHNC